MIRETIETTDGSEKHEKLLDPSKQRAQCVWEINSLMQEPGFQSLRLESGGTVLTYERFDS